MSAERFNQLLVWVGGVALLIAMGVDTIAMLGRHARIPLLGSIEIVQCAVLVAASVSLLLTTLRDGHARVHLLLDRMSPPLRRRADLLHCLATVLFVLALLIGSAWMTVDLWNGHEESELLRIPYRPLRITVLLMLAGLLIVNIRNLARGMRQ